MSEVNILQQAKEKLGSGFFAFWLKQWRATILFLIMLLLVGVYSAIQIPKESMPEINLGMVTITTVYPGGNPEDINALITEKIENQIETLDGISKITATSADSLSNVLVTLSNDADIDSLTKKIQDAVKKVALPADAKDPMVTQIDTKTIGKRMFSMILYAKDNRFGQDYLKDRAQSLKSALEGMGKTDTIDIQDGDNYEVQVLVDQNKIEQLWLSLAQLSSILQAYNSNQPLGTHELGNKQYAFRIDGEVNTIEQLKQLPIPLGGGKVLNLGNIATVKASYQDGSLISIGDFEGEKNEVGKTAVLLTFNKKPNASVLSAATDAKARIAQELNKNEYRDLGYFFSDDLGEKITKSYTDLAVNMISTLVIVFLIVWMFVGSVESFLATVSIPLAFFVTFFVLNALGYTMNTLTNFSLILCLGIAVDMATVIIQGASEYIKAGYKPMHAALLSLKTYKNSLISGTATTVVVFIPLMSLPGVMGSFLAYIPITIFVTLLASLFISLTITPALFSQMSRAAKVYEIDEEAESFLDKWDMLILEEDRIGRMIDKEHQQLDFRDRTLEKVVAFYQKWVNRSLANVHRRAILILIPIVLLVFTTVFVASRLGFVMMPATDGEELNITLTAVSGLTKGNMVEKSEGLHQVLSQIPEVVNYTATIKGNTISILLRILPKEERARTAFDIEDELAKKLHYLEERGFQVGVSIDVSGPQSGAEIGIKLLAQPGVQQSVLTKVARDFKEYLASLPGTKNVMSSSEESPGQFVFTLDKEKLAMLGLTPKSVASELYLALNGMNAGSIKIGDESHDIKIQYDQFSDAVAPEALMGMVIPMSAGKVSLGSIGSYTFEPAVNTITRERGEITVTISSNLQQGHKAEGINAALYEYAESYDYPQGVSYSKWWEQEENADLIFALLSAFVFAFVVIFAILVLQFNSYTQPLIISYSIFMGFVGATWGMLITGYPYTMMFMIGFVALMGIVVNNAIILIDSANENQQHGYTRPDAIKESAKSRLKPILSTTLTTVIGLATLTSDGFFAPLAWTIMFGLSVATVMTLFAIPALYQDENKLRILIKRVLLKPILMVIAPAVLMGILYLLGFMFGFDLFGNSYTKSAMIALFVSTAIFLIIWEFIRNSEGRAWWRQALLHLKMAPVAQAEFSKRKIFIRLLIKFGLLIVPILIGLLMMLVFKLFGVADGVSALALQVAIWVAYLFYVVANFYSFWTSEDNQFLHDRLSGLTIVDEAVRD